MLELQYHHIASFSTKVCSFWLSVQNLNYAPKKRGKFCIDAPSLQIAARLFLFLLCVLCLAATVQLSHCRFSSFCSLFKVFVVTLSLWCCECSSDDNIVNSERIMICIYFLRSLKYTHFLCFCVTFNIY